MDPSGRILLVDSDPACLRQLDGLLSQHLPKVDVDVAGSGEIAMRYVQARDYDAVVYEVDLLVHEVGGVLGEIESVTRNTPVLLITAHPNLLPVLVGSGAFGFMRKPVNPAYFVTAVRNALTYGRLSRRIREIAAHKRDERLDLEATLDALREQERDATWSEWHRT
ncbi:response regulator [Candidatus Nitrospira bockiana]